MLKAVVWPHHEGPTLVNGWRYEEPVSPEEIDDATADVAESAPFARGSHRWIEWRLGRHAARQAAARAGVLAPVVEVADSGAPLIHGGQVGVSIAHTRGVVLAAVAPGEIGIDVERVDRDVSRLVRGLHPGEVDVAISVGVVAALVAKESVAKATGLGLGGSLARWPLIDAELSGETPRVSVAAPDGRILTTRLFPWQEFIVGITQT